MTVADNTSRNQYTATSGQTVFAYTFEIVDKGDIVVLKNGTTLSEGTNYTVSNVGNDSGGNVTLTVGATTGDILTLYRDMPYSRTQNYTNSGDFLASEVNSDFDNLWLAGEQTQRSFSQSIRKPITDSDSISMELPVAASRASSFLTFDAAGAVTTTAITDPSAPSSIFREQFTGDGTTTAFTLGFDSGSVGSAIIIYIDGVYQEGDTYSASGTSLVFTEAPPTNASIEVMYFKVAVAADIDTTGTIYSQQFTGNGSTTAYTLGIPPGSTGKALQIFINGVYQDQGSYTVSGATLTFSEAPPNTSQIDVIAFRIKEIGATDANLVTYTPAGTGAVPTTVQTKLRETVSVKDFGAVGDGVTDDTAAIQAALDAADTGTCKKVIFPAGTYKTTAQLTIRQETVVNIGNADIKAYFNNGYIFAFEAVGGGLRPQFKLIGEGGSIAGAGAFAYDSTLDGILIESSSFSEVGGFSISAVNRPIMIAPTGRDCINNVFRDIDTNTNIGMRINAGTVSGTTYANTTTGTFRDMFFTVIGANNGASPARAVEIIAGDNGSIFGLNFDRCSFNPVHEDGGEYIQIVNQSAFTTNNINTINFYNCEGESRFTGSTLTRPAIYVERAFNCYFNVDAYFDETTGIQLVNCQKCVFDLMQDNIDTDTDDLFINIDANSRDNVFRNVAPRSTLLSTEEDYTTAPLASTYWKRISDSGVNTRFEGMISSDVKRVLKTDYFRDISPSGNLLNPLFAGYESTSSWVNNGSSYSVTSTNENGFKFQLPSFAELNKEYVVRLKYRFTGSISGIPNTWRIATSTGGTQRNVSIPVTTDTTEVMFRTKMTDVNCRVESSSASGAVTIEIFELEIFESAFPYIYNYVPSDIEDSFYLNPRGTFTPEIADAATGGNAASGGTFRGHYSKSGDAVTVFISAVNVDTTGMTASNDLFVRNLPYDVATLTGTINFPGPVTNERVSWSTTTHPQIQAEMTDGTSAIRLAESQTGTNGKDYLRVTEFASGVADIYITMTYLVD